VSAEQSFDGEITLVSQIDPSSTVNEEVFIHGDTGIGGPEVPCTYATMVDWSRFDVFVDGVLVHEDLSGEWVLIQALRRSDGAIRQSALIYSPLLREESLSTRRNKQPVTFRSDEAHNSSLLREPSIGSNLSDCFSCSTRGLGHFEGNDDPSS